jgi:hypothetical protein
MKKITLITLSFLFLAACGGKKGDEKKADSMPVANEETKPAATGQDAELTLWLGGKKLVSTRKEPQFDMWNNLKLSADGSCMDKDNASAKWSVKDGKFIFESVMNITKDMEKKDDTTLVFKGAVGDDIYVVKPIN